MAPQSPSDSAADEVRAALAPALQRFGPDYWREQDAAKTFPTEFFDTIGDAGYFGTFIPEEYGGLDAGARVAAVLVEEINRSGGDAASINAQMAICRTLVLHGTEEQKRKYLPGVASGGIRFLTVAATEPDSGANMAELASTARRDGDDWVINAGKILISFAKHTRLMILLARADEGTTLFLLDLDEVGDKVEMHPIDLVAHRMTSSLFIDDLRVPDNTRIGPVGGGLACLMKGFVIRRVLAASEAIGNARFLLDRSIEYAKTRKTFGELIGVNQGIQYPLVQAYAKVEAADLMRWDVLDVVDRGEDAVPRSAMVKVLASEAAWETSRAALTTFGGWGLASEYHVERKLREGTVYVFNNLLMNLIADRALGLPKK
ncbi:MAG: acyl-CoA/acyl-ACP dehydrogenase [Deltaproteobacteria bacterium]|nr:acyl-CoA/acyl-ACP dehydrogenase [Deltaproteobacteria bacterium]MBW1874888.1 acyl-CoA/acyl-ACP dehydrogenase [Deltaproteobacteria bacterium]MBW2210225.1 acyl-CoA/acyl-ACP dehydrogenase [Deltaproteobacteria bacterium]MBW2214305.1 acyl-CoA/acyl-ACP dehydrogenase [Deltaproteobacteria bacterium]MBW2381109.1 acyl-CoA/acyl-ACP dehydrogenase [Deltaproteobacteria bacterium]